MSRPTTTPFAGFAPAALRFRARRMPLSADPRRSPFRIYRDVRFSKDTSPYQTHLSASFPWIGEGGGVEGYFRLQPGEIFVGGGMYDPGPARLAAWRNAAVNERAGVHAVLDEPAFRAEFGMVDGDRLTRAPAGFPADDPDIELLRLKDVVFRRRLSDADVLSADLPATLTGSLGHAVPLLRLLAGLPGHEEPVA